MRNIITGIVVITFAVFFYVQSYSINDTGFDPLGPRFLPQLVLGAMLFLGVIVTATGILEYRLRAQVTPEGKTNAGAPQQRYMSSIAIIVLLALYIGLLNTRLIGFEWITGAFILGSGLTLGPWSRRNLIKLGVTCVVAPPLVTWIFKTLFFVSLP